MNHNNTIKKNPFAVLDIDASADKQKILQHVVTAMKKRQYDAKTIVESQKSLFNPRTRAVKEFQYFITIEASENRPEELLTESYVVPDLINFTNE